MHPGKPLRPPLMKLHYPRIPSAQNTPSPPPPLHSAFINLQAQCDEVDPGVPRFWDVDNVKGLLIPHCCASCSLCFIIINPAWMRKRPLKFSQARASQARVNMMKRFQNVFNEVLVLLFRRWNQMLSKQKWVTSNFAVDWRGGRNLCWFNAKSFSWRSTPY